MHRHLPILSHSSITCYQRCPQEFEYAYVMRRRPKRVGGDRDFGTAVHAGLAAHWATGDVDYALSTITESAATLKLSLYDAAKARAMLTGYHLRWPSPVKVGHSTEVSQKWSLTMRGRRAKGEFDAVVTDPGGMYLVEHKTTTSDISVGSPYWAHVQSIDPQVTMYLAVSGARFVLYDVLARPKISPLQATPRHAIKYTIPTRSEPVPRLYAGQRLTAETPDEFESRVIDHIASRPLEHYSRQEVYRTAEEVKRYLSEVEATSGAIERAEDAGLYPRHLGACRRFNAVCDYAPVCQGYVSITDPQYDKERT